jgi:gliding motility-associated-like protein
MIANPPAIMASVSASSQVSCFNATDGEIVVSANGGTGSYMYALNGGAAQSSNIFNGLSAGNYEVIVSDANGCSYTVSNIMIANPPAIMASVSASSQVSCFNATDGEIEISANGGTGAYSYSLNGGAAQSSNVFSGLAAGNYEVVVSDVNGCSYTVSNIMIANPPAIMASVNASSQVSCFNALDGEIVVSANGGTGSYMYALNGGAAQSSNIFNGLSAGTYEVVVSDVNGCSYTVSNIVIANPPAIMASVTASSQVSCFNALDGEIVVSANGGTGAYSYSLNGGAAQSSNIFSGLAAGSYSIVVSDINGCMVELGNIFIINPDAIRLGVNVTAQVSCHDANDGQIVATPTGGTGSYMYSLNGGPFQSSNTFSGLPAGIYSVVVMDANGCTYTVSNIFINNPPALLATAGFSAQVSCYNVSDGYISVMASGGTGAYQYSINNGPWQSSSDFSNLIPGLHVVTVMDANSCLVELPAITIANPDQLVLTLDEVLPVSCYNAADGQITVSASGGTGMYSYTINGNPQSSGVFTGLGAGSYVIAVYDENRCVVTSLPVSFINPLPVGVFVTGDLNIECAGNNDGVIEVYATGGNGNYNFSLNGGMSQSSGVFSGLAAGYYEVLVTDANGCSNLAEVVINSVDALVIDYKTYCKAGEVGIQVNASGGSGVYQYSIDGGITWSNNNIYESLPLLHTLEIMVSDDYGCVSSSLTVPVTSLNTLSAEAMVVNQNNCYASDDAIVEIVAQGGVPPYTYTLNGTDYFGLSQISGLGAGMHSFIIRDSNGCPAGAEVVIRPAVPVTVEVNKLSDADCFSNDFGSAEIMVSGGQWPYQFTWSSGENTSSAYALYPGVNTVTVTDANGCTHTEEVKVDYVVVDVKPEINNVFTPNNDGVNDVWTIKHLENYPENEVVVINRWGNEVFTAKNYRNDWDGSRLAEGTYFYVVKVNICKELKEYSGYVTILR